jgi:hypothetical protein
VFPLPIADEFGPIFVNHENLPSFVNFTYPNYYINPNKKESFGTFTVFGAISNKYISKKFRIKIIVTNTPPKFIQKIPPFVEINNLEPKTIILPQVKDEENNSWSMKIYHSTNSKLPDFLEV